MKIYSERVAAVLELTQSTEVLFYYDFFKGKIWGNIRRFSKSAKYTGPTKSGIKFKPEILPKIIESFQEIEKRKDTIKDEELLRLPKTNTRDLVICVSVYKGSLGIDVREWQHNDDYTGWTKRGIRFNIDHVSDVLEHLQKMMCTPIELSEVGSPTVEDNEPREQKLDDTDGIPKKFRNLFTEEE